MGYMGLGMRKETYQRQPKEAFKKQKDRSYLNRIRRKPVTYSEEQKAAFSEELKEKYASSKLRFIKPILFLSVLGACIFVFIKALLS